MDVEGFAGACTGALIGGSGLNLLAAVVPGCEPSWLLFLVGAFPGMIIGYRHAERISGWWGLWWPWP
jgi:hypothetical protein